MGIEKNRDVSNHWYKRITARVIHKQKDYIPTRKEVGPLCTHVILTGWIISDKWIFIIHSKLCHKELIVLNWKQLCCYF